MNGHIRIFRYLLVKGQEEKQLSVSLFDLEQGLIKHNLDQGWEIKSRYYIPDPEIINSFLYPKLN